MKRLLERRGFRLLFIGQGVSALGDWMVTVALMALVLRLSGSSTAVGGILVLRLFPATVAGPLAARAATRWDRRRTMLTMDLARAAIVVAIPLIAELWWVYFCAFLLEVGGLVFLPARDASIPDLATEDDLPVANGLILGSSYGTIPLGAGAFAAVSALSPHHGFLHGHPFALVFWVDAVTFLVSYWFIRELTELGETETTTHSEMSGGFRAAFRIPLVRTVMPATATVALGLGALFSLGIVFVRDVLNASDTEFGVLIALFGVGATVGLVLLRVLRVDDAVAPVRWGVAAEGATIAVMSLTSSVALAFLGAAAFGAATSFTLAAGMSALQEALDGEERVLAFTAFHVVIRGGLSLAAIGAGVAADVLDSVRLPVLGKVPPSRLVLVCSGVLVSLSSGFIHERQSRH